ncbi:hypothetical protein A1O1_05596 [Capronia coronata CBS 617.96]|uniref:RRM domain-containing protein n=1 Tax=Capronia coronata CBS 617.96 TaxID=1182541 RepID=W9YG58_9EURO|nr:uncharacterized protein A1O1_05596 [Capronia coronata CBS 617.96]EXJ88665.1 hypothetical protein A1O1_05596 [Capronia coronata CBS 617.96]
MSKAQGAVSFDAIIQADRQKRKNEALAREIFGRNKQNKNDSKSATKSLSRTPDLASRITKRSSSVASANSPRNNPFTSSRPASAAPQKKNAKARFSRIESALDSPQANVVPSSTSRRTQGHGLSIKGKAGPFVVEASNFAPGTTAADIESALQSDTFDDNGVSAMLSCRIVSTSPAVVAEMIFTEKHIADKIISTYHNQRADGKILQLFLKRSGGGLSPFQRSQQDPTSHPGSVASEPPVAAPVQNDNAMEDIEMEAEPHAAYAEQDQHSRDTQNPESNGLDERHGYGGSQASTSHDHHGSRRDTDRRDRERGNHREREREPERERDRDRDMDRHERRDDRGSSSYRRDDRPESYNSRFSHYGNGVGGGFRGRGSFGSFPRGGGRMYGDDTMRGGRRGGGPGASFGGGYRRGY